jgi:hypothetical protein
MTAAQIKPNTGHHSDTVLQSYVDNTERIRLVAASAITMERNMPEILPPSLLLPTALAETAPTIENTTGGSPPSYNNKRKLPLLLQADDEDCSSGKQLATELLACIVKLYKTASS